MSQPQKTVSEPIESEPIESEQSVKELISSMSVFPYINIDNVHKRVLTDSEVQKRWHVSYFFKI